MQIKVWGRIYSDMKNYMIAHQHKITDFNAGGGLTSQLETWAQELGKLYIDCQVGFFTFLRALPYSVFGFVLKAGTKASATVRFIRSRPFAYDTSIPAKTRVSAGNLIFETVTACVVPSGEGSSGPVEVIALGIGEKYNVDAGMINNVVTTLSADIVKVENEYPATGGKSTESWKDYVVRFANYILGLQRTNGAGFRTALTGGHAVRSLEIVEHFPPLNNIWNVTVYVEDGTGEIPDLSIGLMKRIIDGDGRTPKNAGYRAPGINVRYLPPEIVYVHLNIKVTTKQDVTNEIDKSVVIEDVTKKAKGYINGLWIKEGYIKSELTVIIKRITYLRDTEIETENIKIARNQILRFLSCYVDVEVG